MALTDQEFARYSRQIMVPEFAVAGQEALGKAHVLVVGAGGLGAAALPYLAAAGVGHLVIADHDVVDASNLQRQVIYRDHQQGESKVKSAQANLKALNPHIQIRAVEAKLADQRLSLEVSMADVVLDCSDNLATRHQINAACVAHGKTLISGAAIGWHGQLMCFVRDQSGSDAGCYHCLFPQVAGQNNEPRNCAQSGVIGPVVGTMGTMQALEAIKYLAGLPLSAAGFSQFDGLQCQWHQFAIAKDPHCPVCGQAKEASCKSTSMTKP
ncbi:Molybdopterin-synthase adenylyltransferase [Vibrio stylophorae]|uniref:Molybdopterin-synthase adenylyltransferase n=1 Tax=Vibrio stylophorae TaxID=659351 RepID=A0ABM8ZPL6_9VIBR|nr:HesA/MoeB/ThiF family protein [Vibrio stylophorae]CAH0532252.1 Molybdopterin-synthase adenylyltransferase [Vibrio stylophorae]